MKLDKILLEDISQKTDPRFIKNFIISDTPISAPNITSEHPYILDGVAFAICIKGSGRIKINFREFEIRKNTIITILPHFVIETTNQSDDFVLEYLVFSVDFLTEIPHSPNYDIARNIVQAPCIKVSDTEAKVLLDFHAFIVKQYKRTEHPFRQEITKSLLYSLLAEIGGIYFNKEEPNINKENTPAAHQQELAYRFFKLLLAHHQTERSLNFYADKMCLTAKHISTTIKQVTGRTAFEWINEATISLIKHLLKTTDLTVLQISEQLDFPNPSFFGRFFKTHTGMTPIQYRES